MTYFWIFLFSFAGVAVLLSVYVLRIDLFTHLATKYLVAFQAKKNLPFFASSVVLRKIVCFLFKRCFWNKKARLALDDLVNGKSNKAIILCRNAGLNFYSEILLAYTQPSKALHSLLKLNTPDANVEAAALLFECGDFGKARNLLEDGIDDKALSSYSRAKKSFYLASLYLKDANMESASTYAAKAANLFKKNSAFLEEAQSYLLQGTIFRISAVEDVAHFMFCQAKDLFLAFHHPVGEADALANLGMLWTLRENFDVAQKYFAQSWKINAKLKRYSAAAYVLTHWALALVLCKKNIAALPLLKKALTIHVLHNDIRGQAFVFEVMAYLYSSLQKWKETALAAQKASLLYEQFGLDVSSLIESFYLYACAMFNLDKLGNAEKFARKCIDLAENNCSCFHVANAYNLLGLIFLAKNDLSRAKAIFLKSASIEQKNERFSGAATDYVNIALIESRLGNQTQALKTFYTALKYAEAFEESDLSNLIKGEIKKLENHFE